MDNIVEGVMHIMQGAPERKTCEDGLPLPPFAVYTIGNSSAEKLLNFVNIIQQELLREKVLPVNYIFEEHKGIVPMHSGDVLVTYTDMSALEWDFGFGPSTLLRESYAFFQNGMEFYIT